jgi:hypothetical protein
MAKNEYTYYKVYRLSDFKILNYSYRKKPPIQMSAKIMSFPRCPQGNPGNPVINMSLDSRIRGNDKVSAAPLNKHGGSLFTYIYNIILVKIPV